MIILNRPPSRALCFSLGALLGLLIVVTPLYLQVDAVIEKQQHIYGQALADSTAREAIEAAFTNDRVSLRAILHAVANQPNVVRASIHNVENRVLVQAGPNINELPTETLHFEAAISLADSIAGSVLISIAPDTWPAALNFGFFATLIALTVLFSLWRLWVEQLFTVRLPAWPTLGEEGDNDTDAQDQYERSAEDATPETEDEPEALEPTPVVQSAYSALCVKNVGVLKQQLNGATFRDTFAQLEHLLDQIGALYGARQRRWDKDRYVFRFDALDDSEALFNAACASRIMLDLAGIVNRVPLDLSAQVSVEENNVSEAELPFVGLAVDVRQHAGETLDTKVDFLDLGESEEDRRLIARFQAPYDALLLRQSQQLRGR